MRELALIQQGQPIEHAISQNDMAEAVRRELERLLAENAPLAYRVALGVLRNPADAEDVAQEALIRAYRKFGRLRDVQRFRSWLVRVSFRLALDRSRSARRREKRERLWAKPELRPPLQTVEEIAASRQFEERLALALDELPDRLRLVLLLTAIEGNSVEDAATLLGVPSGTVKSRLFAARKRLAEKLR